MQVPGVRAAAMSAGAAVARDGNDLISRDIVARFPKAGEPTSVRVRTIEGEWGNLTVPADAKVGQALRIRGRGGLVFEPVLPLLLVVLLLLLDLGRPLGLVQRPDVVVLLVPAAGGARLFLPAPTPRQLHGARACGRGQGMLVRGNRRRAARRASGRRGG